MNQKKQAFTLVELIVVITILAILGTIAFLSLSGYSKDSRNSVRYNDLELIKSSLELYSQKTGVYPESTLPVTITFAQAEAWTQGTFGQSTFGSVGKLDHLPVDPLTGTEYTYSLLNTKGEYELAAALEGIVATNDSIINKTYAGTLEGTSLVLGTYNGNMLPVSTGGLDYVLAVPTIVSGDTTLLSVDEIMFYNKLAYNGSRVLAGNYKNTEFDTNNTFNYGFTSATGGLIIFTGAIEDLKNDEYKRMELISNLQKTYSGTVLENNIDYKGVVNESINSMYPLYNTKELVTNVIENSLNIKVKYIYPNYDIELDELNNKGGTARSYMYSGVRNNDNYIGVGTTGGDLSTLTGGSVNSGGYDFSILQFGEDLSFKKVNNFGGTSNDFIEDIIFDGVNYIGLGYSYSDLSGFPGGTVDNSGGAGSTVLMKFDKDLNLISLKQYGNMYLGNLINIKGKYIGVGSTDSDLTSYNGGSLSTTTDFLVVEFDNALDIVKVNNFGGPGYDYLAKIIFNGVDYTSVGSSDGDLSGVGGNNTSGGYDFVISKFNKQLDLTDIKNFGSPGDERFDTVAYDGINYIGAGSSNGDLSSFAGGKVNQSTGYDLVLSSMNNDLDFVKLVNFGKEIKLGTLTNSSWGYFSDIIYDGQKYVTVGGGNLDLSDYPGGVVNENHRSYFTIGQYDKDLNILKLNNFGDGLNEHIIKLFANGKNYIGLGYSSSDLSAFSGGTARSGVYDYVMLKF